MFRVGDQVAITGPSWSGKTDFIGQIGVITDTGNDKKGLEFRVDVPPIGDYLVEDNNRRGGWYRPYTLRSLHSEVFKAIKRHEALLEP